MTATDDMIPQQFYHGTRADLKPGDLIVLGYNSNYGKRIDTPLPKGEGILNSATDH